MAQRGSLVVVSGFSGVGKGTVVNQILNRYEQYALSISCTTRAPREGEKDGVSYFFVERETFEGMIRDHELIEHACYCGNYYGTPRSYVEKKLEEGIDVILEIEIQGAMQIRNQYPDAVLIFLLPPDADALLERLRGRGTETEDVIRARLGRAVEEGHGIDQYDYVFVNDTPEACAERIDMLIRSQRSRTDRNTELISIIRSQLETKISDWENTQK